jgi:hypothetical protein
VLRRSMFAGGILALSFGVGATAFAISLNGNAARARQRPPAPRVSTLGVTRAATLDSYCWNVSLGNGSSTGTCADGTFGHPDHTVLWRPAAKLVVHQGLPVHDVHIQAVRLTSRGARPTHVIQLHLMRADRTGRSWSLRLPRKATHDNELLISARFTHGDAEAEIGILPAPFAAKALTASRR